MSRALLFSLLASSLLASACGGAPKKKVHEAPPEDPWDRTPHSDEWLHATRDVSGGHEAECKAVAEWIAGEEGCRATVCAHAKDLAKDWLSRCKPHDAGDVATVEEQLAVTSKRAKQDETPCGGELEAILQGECEGDKTCRAPAAAWATRCGATDGTPLVMRMLERSVERRAGERVKLDARSCGELLAEVTAGASCAQQFACEDALRKVETYRMRCEGEGKPSLAAAVLTLAITHGADKKARPVLAQTSTLTAREISTALDDGTGAALWVCGERTVDLASYLAKRRACKDGTVVYAKAFKREGGLEVRLGTLAFPDDRTFSARFPTLAVDGEAELRDAQALSKFEADLGAVAKSTPAEGVALLGRTMVGAAAAIRRSAAFREALSAADAGLGPAMRELGKLKAAAAKKKMTVAELAGFHARAQERAFADLSDAGVVTPGVATRATELETAELLPRSMAAYLEGYRPADAVAKLRKVDAKTAGLARSYAKIQATACGAAQKRLSEAEQQMIACAFGAAACDEARVSSLTRAIDESRAAAEGARHQLDTVMTGAAQAYKGELVQLAATEGCLEPWW